MKNLIIILLLLPFAVNGSLRGHSLEHTSSSSRQSMKGGGVGGRGLAMAVKTRAPTKVKTSAPTKVKTPAPTKVKTPAPTKSKTPAPKKTKKPKKPTSSPSMSSSSPSANDFNSESASPSV